MLLKKLELLRAGLVYSRLIVSNRYDYTGILSFILIRLDKTAWIESQISWKQTILSVIAGQTEIIINDWPRLPVEKRVLLINQINRLKASITPTAAFKRILSKRAYSFTNKDFLWHVDHKADMGLINDIRLLSNSIAYYSGVKELTPSAKGIELEVLSGFNKLQDLKIETRDDLDALIDLIGHRDSIDWRRIAGQYFSSRPGAMN